MPLYEFRCARHGLVEAFAPTGARVGRCHCGRFAARRYSATLMNPPNFGKNMVAHTTGRRLSPAERERREHWNRTRFGKVPGLVPEDKTPKPRIFD